MWRLGLWISALVLAVVPGLAESKLDNLPRLLVDLPGFTAAEPNGSFVNDDQGVMAVASRHYARGAAALEASLIVGQLIEGALAPLRAGAKVESVEGRLLSDEADGFRLVKTYSARETSGSLFVALGKQAALSINYKGMSEADALALARKLDWKALAAAAN